MGYQLNLTEVPIALRQQAAQAFEDGDAEGLGFSRERRFGVIADNITPLKRRGIYEECLLYAYQVCKNNCRHWPQSTIDLLFRMADRSRLRRAGAAVPDQHVSRLYRGVAGDGRARRL